MRALRMRDQRLCLRWERRLLLVVWRESRVWERRREAGCGLGEVDAEGYMEVAGVCVWWWDTEWEGALIDAGGVVAKDGAEED